jgi:hypothetical protein
MALLLLLLLLVIIFAGLGFAAHILWILALVFLVAWVAGFAFRGGGRSRWYRW